GNDSYEQISGAIEMDEAATPSAASEEEGEGEDDSTANGGESNGAVGVMTNGIVYDGGILSNRVTGKIKITAKKTWVAAALQNKLGDVKVTLELQKKCSNDKDWGWANETVVLDGFCAELMTRAQKLEVSEFDEMGHKIEYRWVETKIEKDGQVIELDPDPETGASTFQLQTTEDDIDSPYQFESSVDENGAVTNKLVGTTSYKIIKEWEDQYGKPTNPPEGTTIDVDLTCDEQHYASYTLDGDASTEPGKSVKGETLDDQGWTVNIDNLPKYDDEGHRLTYIAEEKGIKPEEEALKWSTDYEYRFLKKGDEFDGIIITNRIPTGAHYYILVNKQWKDDGDEANRMPVTIAIYNGSKSTTEPEKTVTLDAGAAWWEKVEVEENPKTNDYYIREVAVGDFPVLSTSEDEGEDDPFGASSYVETDRNTYVVTYEPPTTALGIPRYIVTNRRVGTVDITVNKTWVDPDATEGEARPDAMLSLECEEYPEAVTLSTDSTQGSVNIPNLPDDESVTLATQFEVDKENQESSYTFKKLPKYDINGRVIHYTVTEELGESPEGSDKYESEVVAESYSPHGKFTDQDDQTIDFENTIYATTQAVFHKHWNDEYQNSLGHRPDIYLELWQKTSTDEKPVLTDYKPREWTKDSSDPTYNETCIFPDLPKYDEYGEEIIYYASEHSVVDETRFDYTVHTYSHPYAEDYLIESDDGTKLLLDDGTFTNGCEKNLTITGTKQWENVPKGFIKNDLPIVTIHLEQHQRGTAEDAWTEIASVESDNSLTEWASGGYECKFTITQTKDGQPVPYYDENGALYEYRVKETFNKKTEEGFDIAYEADPKINAFSVSNTFISEKDKENTYGTIMVDKYWDRSKLDEQDLPYPATTFVLTRAYESDTEGTLVKDDYFSLSKTLSPDDAACGGERSRVEFTDLLRFAPNGKPYIYTVTEKTIDGYTTCVGSGTAEPSGEGNTIVANNDVLKDTKDDAVSFKNSYEPGQVNVTGTKLWNDYNNAFGIRPENIKVELHRKAPAMSGYDNAIEDEVVLGADGNPLEPTWQNDPTAETWTYTFENLDRYAPNGKAWQYQVVEIAAESDPDGFYGTEDQSTGWKTAGATGDVVLNEITNKFDMQASVSKQWKGDGPNDDDIYGLRPTSVTVKLQVKEEGGTWQDAADALGTGIESGLSDIVLSSGNRWSHTFRNLPPARKVDGNVVMLSYRVVETKLGDQQFDATVGDDGSYTFAEGSVNLNYKPSSTTSSTKTSSTTTITNTMVDSLVLAATKIWDRDLSNAFGTRPGNGNVWTITLTLQRSTNGTDWVDVQKAGSAQTVTVTISGDNGKDKETTFEYLPRYDAAGNTYQYRVVEEKLGAYYEIDTNDPEHYKYEYSGDAGEGEPSFAIDLVNEMITTNVSGTKEWKTFQDGVIPDPSAVKLTLYWSTPNGQKSKVPVQPEYTWTKTDTGTWEYRYEEDVLPMYDKAGQKYTYTVEESPVDGYNISYKPNPSLNVTNTQALGSVTFTKKSTDGKLLARAKFKLTHPDGTTETRTTDANGKVTLTDLKWGDYTVTEIESPEGYWFDKSDNALGFLPFVSSNDYTKTFTINAQNCKQNINLGSFENKATDIQFAKVDDEGKAVSGAKLKLTGRFAGSNAESSITWTSGSAPKNITAKMVVGETYTLSEAERTYGFRTLPGSVSFVMNDDGTITITQNVQIDGQDLASVDKNGMKLTLTNKRILGGVQLTKTIDGPDNPLARDVRFDLYREGSSTPIKTNLATDSEGIIAVDKLGEGNYYFKETKTIDGAILSTEKVKFSITEQQHAQTVYVSLDNKSTDLSIAKVDDEGNALAGAKLTLTGKFADTSQTAYSWTSGDTPEQFTRKLIVGQEYELSEEGRVDGYRTLPGTVKFRIQSDGTIKITQNTNYQGEGKLASVSSNGLQLNLTNSKILAHVQLAKTIDGEGGLKGVTFNLYKEGESAPLKEGLVTNEAGVILVENLPEGSYYFQETATVEGAILDTAKLPFTIEEKDHGKIVSVGMDNRSTNVSIMKTDDRGNTLAGAKLQLTGRFAGDAEASTVDWTSGDAAKQFKGNLIVGEPYTLSETGRVAGHVTLPNPITFTVTAEGKIAIDQNAEYEGTELARVSESGLELTLSNPEIRASAQLTKTLDGTGKLEGATFSVYQKGNNGDTLIKEGLVTDRNGRVKIDNLAEGEYYFVETATIDGAILDESHIDFEITEDLDGTVVERTADNQTTKISIAKLVRDSAAGEGDPADGDPLPGAKLELTGKFAKTASDTISWTSRTAPKELVGELIVGETYTLTETNRPAGYVQAASSVQFKVLEDGTIEITKNTSFDGKDLASVTNGGLGLNFSNAKIRGSVELTKTIDESEPLEGAVFDLYQKDAKQPLQTGLTTNEDGKIKVDDLAEGEYFFKETATVEGAILNTDTVEFAIGKDDFGKTVEVKADNTSTSIGILKVNSDKNPWNGDLADGATLEGAQLQLTGRFAGETESKTIEWTSGEQAEQFAGKLIVGEEYTLSEKGRVDDYVTLPGTVTFKLDDAGKIQIIDDETGLATVGDDKLTLKLANVKVRGSVELTKTLNDDKQPLKGAVFDLVATSGDGMIGIIIERNLITDANGKIVVDNLPEGKYRFEETRTVNGVIVHEDPIHFEITENDHGKVVAAKAINETTKISFLKVNSDPEPGEGELGDGDPLPGAKMQLTGKFAKTTEDSITWISGEEPEVLDGELIVGETYTLTEIGRVDGYTRWNGSVKIWVRDDGTISIIKNSHLGNVRAELTEDSCGLTLNNVKVRGSVELTKTIDDNEPLEGAQFDLYAKGADKPLQTGLATDADGKIVVDNLPEGSYFFKETATIEGAILNTQPVEFEIAERDHGKVVKASADNESTKISILKVNSDPEPGEGELADKAPLAGAKLQITGRFAGDEELSTYEWTSTEDAEQFSRKLIAGEQYTITEPERVPGYVSLPNPIIFQVTEKGTIEIIQNAKVGNDALASVDKDALNLSLANVKVRGSVELAKTIDGEEPLEGAVFDLYREGQDKPIATGLATNEEGKITVGNLAEGEYYFQETATVEGAILNPEPVTFQIAEGHHANTVYVNPDNESTNISILKVNRDSAPGEGELADDDPLEGASLKLTGHFANKPGVSSVEWTSAEEANQFLRQLVVGEEYELAELSRVDGYNAITGSVKFTILTDGSISITQNASFDNKELATITGDALGLTLANVKVRGSVQLAKTIDGDEPLEGAVFDLYKEDAEKPIATGLTTDGEGKIAVSDLPEGKYSFKEIATVEGAILSKDAVKFSITPENHKGTVEIDADNASTSIGILKVNSDNAPGEGELADGAPLPGAQLTLTGRFAGQKETTTRKWDSTEDAERFMRGLIVGEEYTLAETDRVDGYVTLPGTVTFELDGDGKIQIIEDETGLATVNGGKLMLKLANVKVRGSVELAKTIDGDEPLEGAVFDLYREGQDKPIATGLTTDADGKIRVDNLAEGKYYFKETATIEGAILNTQPVEFEIAERDHGKVVKASADNESTKISILKVNRDSDADADENAPEIGNDHDDADVNTGEPIEALDSDDPADGATVDDSEGAGGTGEGNEEATEDETQLTDGDSLPGATLQLTGRFADDEGESTIEWSTSNQNPKKFVRELVVGEEYTLTEVDRVDGYLPIKDPIRFKVQEDGTIKITRNAQLDGQDLAVLEDGNLALTLANVKIRSSVQLTKTLAGEDPVEGVTFSLYKDGIEEPLATNLVTNENGMITVGFLPEGSYYFQETATIPGAILNPQPQHFDITEGRHRQTVELTMDNPKTQISIAKVDQNGEPLEGAQLELSGNFAGTDETTI
ncbi:MAG: SpaA isopeptide-forming pilin-related protein, partial [Eggerthellaceae bacterium]